MWFNLVNHFEILKRNTKFWLKLNNFSTINKINHWLKMLSSNWQNFSEYKIDFLNRIKSNEFLDSFR